jgi:hypothetical protein
MRRDRPQHLAGDQEVLRLRPVPLAVLAAAVTLLGGLGVLPRWQGLVHLVALPPLDQVADLQMLLAYAPGIPSFIAGVLVSLAIRAAVLAWVLGGLTRARFLLVLRFYLVSLPLALVAAGLFYGAMAVLFYALFWIGLALSLLLFAVTAAAPWMPESRLRSGFATSARHGFRLGTLGAYLAALTAIGVVADATGPAGAVVLVPVSAALTYGTAWMLREDPGWRPVRRAVAALPAAAIVALAWVVMTGPAGPPQVEEREEALPGSVLLMSGVDSSSGSGAILEIDPEFMGWTCEETYYFSYAGPGEGQPQADALCQIDHGAPYEAEDTLRGRDEIVGYLERYAADMTQPGVVTGHSQGAWLVWDAASADRLPGVDTVVLVGAFPENRVAYPEAGERAPGRVGRMVLEVIAAGPRPGGTTVFRPDSPLGREWLGHPDAVEEVLARPLPEGMRALSIASAFDLPLLHGSHRVDGAVDACPVAVVHPNLPYAAEFQQTIADFVAGRPLGSCPFWREAVGPLLRHWSVPPYPRR